MSHQYAQLDQVIRRELKASSIPSWSKVREKFPEVPRSSFYHRVRVTKRTLRLERGAKRDRLADPFATGAERRDPFKLLLDLDLEGRISQTLDLLNRSQWMADFCRRRMTDLTGVDRWKTLKSRLQNLECQLRSDNEHAFLWDSKWLAVAKDMGRSSTVSLRAFRKQMLADKEWLVLQGAVKALADTNMAPTGAATSEGSLYRAARARIIALERLVSLRTKVLNFRMMGKQVEWILARLAARRDLSLSVIIKARRTALAWVRHVAQTCAAKRGVETPEGQDAVNALLGRHLRTVPGFRMAMAFAGTNVVTPESDQRIRNAGVRCSSHLSGTTFPEHL